MSDAERMVHFPTADPRPFLEARIRLLHGQAEAENPSGQHESVERFEHFSREFLDGSGSAETLCLYSMYLYLNNQDKLAGTDAAVNLMTFAADFAEIVPISEDRLYELWEDAEHMVKENPRLQRAKEYRDGSRPFPYPMLVIEKGQGLEDAKRWRPADSD